MTPALRLDVAAVGGAVGLAHEVCLLRAAIRRLADEEDVTPHVKTLAELRHQVEALCTALKTQHALDGRAGDLSADLARVLEELGGRLDDAPGRSPGDEPGGAAVCETDDEVVAGSGGEAADRSDHESAHDRARGSERGAGVPR